MISKFTFNNQYILKELPAPGREKLEKGMFHKKYTKNQAVFAQGTYPSGVFYVREGRVKKYKTDTEGREQIVYIYNSGEFFGYSAILSEEPYGDTAVALENSIISFITKQDFIHALETSTQLSRLLLKSLGHEFNVVVNLMAVLSQRTVRERVALCLLILFDKYSAGVTQNEVFITLSRKDLANMAGTVGESLARVLRDFKSEKLITTQGRNIQVLSKEGLNRIVNFY